MGLLDLLIAAQSRGTIRRSSSRSSSRSSRRSSSRSSSRSRSSRNKSKRRSKRGSKFLDILLLDIVCEDINLSKCRSFVYLNMC